MYSIWKPKKKIIGVDSAALILKKPYQSTYIDIQNSIENFL